MYVVLVVNGIFGNVVFIETVYILLQAWVEKNFMQNSNFLRIHLKPTPNKSHQVTPDKSNQVTQVTPDKSHQVTPDKSRQVTQVTPDKSHQKQEDSALSHHSPDRQTGAFKHEQQFCFIPKLKEYHTVPSSLLSQPFLMIQLTQERFLFWKFLYL